MKTSSARLEDTIAKCFKTVRGCRTGFDLVHCFEYLTSIRLKHKFARSRLATLKRKKAHYMKTRIEEFSAKVTKTTWPDNYSVLMEFDHCIISLRSSVEHLLQLVNVVAELELVPKRSRGKEAAVGISVVIAAMDKNRLFDQCDVLRELRENIRSLKSQPWYDHLHRLRIEQFHDKFTYPSLVEHRSSDKKLTDIGWYIPRETDGGRTHVDIIDYCEEQVTNVEDVLVKNLGLLIRYLASKPGEA